jgi:hypothetical protein
MDYFTESSIPQKEANGIVLGKWHDIHKTAHLQKTGPERGKSIVRIDESKIRKKCSFKETELTFYQHIAELGDAQVCTSFLVESAGLIAQKFFPHCLEIDEENGFVVLEDITYEMEWPAVMDIKIGFETHDHHNAYASHYFICR